MSKGKKGALGRWREKRRILRDTKTLLKEARRVMKKHAVRLKENVAEDIRASTAALAEARAEGRTGEARSRGEKLDRLLKKHLGFARKSAAREYGESIGVAVIIALLLRAFVVEAFKIPSGSMIPTLKVGDHLFVNKFSYGLRIPFTRIKFFSGKPTRGDVIVFIYPVDESKDYIKRIVAVSGDTVAVRSNVVYVNGKAIPRKRLGEVPCRYRDADEKGLRDLRDCVAFEERQGEQRYRVVQDKHGDSLDYPKTKIPDGYVFVMGDNRDNSSDSRVWGTVPYDNIKGRALIIWYSAGEPGGVRLRRFFTLVHAFDETRRRTPVHDGLSPDEFPTTP